jgi:hypothetical protein
LLASSLDDANPAHNAKQHETLIKLMQQAVALEEQIKAIRDESKPIEVFVEKFKNVVILKVKEAKSKEAKEAIVDILDSLNSLSDIKEFNIGE